MSAFEHLRAALELYGTTHHFRAARVGYLTLFDSGVCDASENYALIDPEELFSADVEEACRESKKFFRGAPHIWPLAGEASPRAADILIGSGGVRIDPLVEMRLDLRGKKFSLGAIERTRDIADADEWADGVWAGFGSVGSADDEYKRFARGLFAVDGVDLLYLRRDGKLCATGLLSRAGGLAGAYYIATIPSMRRRGFGRIIVDALACIAQEHGHDELFLLATRAGVPLYEACGFIAGRAADVIFF